MKPFQLHEPDTVEQAVGLLSRLGGAASLYAGGTELLLAMKAGLLAYEHLVNVKTVDGLDAIAVDPATGALRIGAAASHRAIESSPEVRASFPLIASVERRVANVRVRNVGTLGGNLCFAEPHADPGALLLLYDAQVEAAGPTGRRTFPLEELTIGPYETSLAEDELLTAVAVPPLPAGMRGAYLKFGLHHRPTIGVGIAVRVSDGRVAEARVAVGSASPRPMRVRAAEGALAGERVDSLDGSTALAEAGRLAGEAADPMDDLHGSAEYKRRLVEVFVARALAEALDGRAE